MKIRIVHLLLASSVMAVLFFISSAPLLFAAACPEGIIPVEVYIPGVTYQGPCDILGEDNQVKKTVKYYALNLQDFVGRMYVFVVGLAGFAAVIMLMAGGYMWLIAGGNTGRVGQAKEIIIGAGSGLALALGSYVVLLLINPALVELKPFEPNEPTIAKVGGVYEVCDTTKNNSALAYIGNLQNPKLTPTAAVNKPELFKCGSIFYPNKDKLVDCQKAPPSDDPDCKFAAGLTFAGGCMATYCQESGFTDYACIIEADSAGVLTGGTCQTSLTVHLDSDIAPNTKSHEIDDSAGNTSNCSVVDASGQQDIYNDCPANQDNTCTLVTDGTMPFWTFNGAIEGGVRSYYRGQVVRMACRDKISSAIKSIANSLPECTGNNCLTP